MGPLVSGCPDTISAIQLGCGEELRLLSSSLDIRVATMAQRLPRVRQAAQNQGGEFGAVWLWWRWLGWRAGGGGDSGGGESGLGWGGVLLPGAE